MPKVIVKDSVLSLSRNLGTPSVKITVRATVDLESGRECDKVFSGDIWLSEKAIMKILEKLENVFGWTVNIEERRKDAE